MPKEKITVMVSRAVVIEVTTPEPLTDEQRSNLARETAFECCMDVDSSLVGIGIAEGAGLPEDSKVRVLSADFSDDYTHTSENVTTLTRKEFRKAYSAGGIGAVCDLANTVPDQVDWVPCYSCDAVVPVLKGRSDCPVCGSSMGDH